MNSLTEAWAIVYLNILTLFLIFTLGIPSMIYEMTVPADLRSVIYPYIRKRNRIIKFGALLFVIFSLLFVLFLHPFTQFSDSQLRIDKLTSNTDSCYFQLKSIISEIIICVSFIGLILLWSFHFRKSVREYSLQKMEKIIKQRFIITKYLEPKLIQDLISLGKIGKSGNEKESVLEVFQKIAQFVQYGKNYNGDKLASLIESVLIMVSSIPEIGSNQNFITSFLILQEIWQKNLKVRKCNDYFLDDDDLMTSKIIPLLGLKALEFKYDYVIQMIIETEISSPETKFIIGKAALQKKNFFIVNHVLNKLKQKTVSAGFGNDKVNAAFLGLLVWLLGSGVSAKSVAQKYLIGRFSQSREFLLISISKSIQKYRDYNDYETADRLDSWFHTL